MQHPYAYYLDRSSQRRGDGLAVIDVARQRTLTWSELRDRVARLAAYLASAGVGPGDRVVIRQRNTHSYLEGACAAAWLGATIVPSLHSLSPAEHDQIVADVCAAFVLDANDVFDGVIAGFKPRPPVMGTSASLAQVLFSSGSTGRPKGIMHSFATTSAAMAGWAALASASGDETTILVTSPISHAAGRLVEAALIGAGTTVILNSARAAPVLDAIETYGVTHMLLVPTVLQDLVDHADLSRRDHSSLRAVIYAAAPTAESLVRRAQERLGPVLHTVYGSTEAPTPVTHLGPGDHTRAIADGTDLLRSCGREYAFGVQLQIRDESGAVVPDGVAGQVAFAGPWTFVGYWNQPELTAAKLIDGWLMTGDVGRLEDGYLYLMDRLDDMIISGGSNVYPVEVENVISEHPAVTEVVVLGEPHPRWGEAVLAVVSLSTALDPSELIDYCRERLSGPKVPKRVVILDALPRNAHDKLSRPQIKAAVLGDAAAISGAR